ncbi:MAG: class A beta-lactamase-related serine hydrolase, partial [Chitinophagaceae bacterium]
MKVYLTKITPIFVAILFSSLIGCGGKGSSDKNNHEDQSVNISGSSTLTQQLDKYLQENQKDNDAGVSILVLKNGEATYASRGMANIDSHTSISKKTGFRLASVSKPFTAVAIMQLVEKGELQLSDSILKYIPELSPTWSDITIEHLLTHRSGIHDIINDFWNPTLLNGLTNTSLIPYLRQNPTLEFTQGTKGDYSNTGYMLLAVIIERKTGLTFPNYMTLHIFGPANMHGSYIVDENQPIKAGDAINYASKNTYYGINTFLKGSMAQVSSAEDFFNFLAALQNGTLISLDTLKNMIRNHSKIISNYNYGYGFVVSDDAYGHSGEWDGFETELIVNYKTNIQLIV